MSLKQECIDFINLITEPLKNDEYDLYKIETDSIRDICELTGEDVTYGDCFDCEHYGNCQYKKHIKVDVSFWDYADFQRNYVFAKKPSVNKGICYINNRKQLMTEMSQFKKEMEQYKDYYAEFGERYSDFMEYAKEFGERLKQEYSFFENISTDILPIVFHADFAKDREGKTDYAVKGDFVSKGKQNVINTYYCMEDTERTKQNIRHELLHYFLYMSDMKYSDDDAIFHYLCGIYDAHAYKEMGEEEQTLYDKLVCAIPRLEARCKEDAFKINRDGMLMAAGRDRDSFSNKELYDHVMKILNMIYEENNQILRRTQAINDTKIQYISVANTKIYKVKNIDLCNLTIEAIQTDLSIADVPENEVFPLEEFEEFRVRLINEVMKVREIGDGIKVVPLMVW